MATTFQRGWLVRLAPLTPVPLLAAVLAYLLVVNPADRVMDGTGPCPWHALFGIDGPTCGGTRMVWYLLRGDLVQAARHHLAALAALPAVGYAWLVWLANWTLAARLRQLRLPWQVYAGYAVAFLVYSTVLRNLPWPPFIWFYVADLTPQ